MNGLIKKATKLLWPFRYLLKEERKIKRQQQQKLKAETQTNSPEDEQQPPLEETTTSTEKSNISNCKPITQKKNEKQKKISSLETSLS